MVFLGQTRPHTAPIQVFTFCMLGRVAEGLEGAGGPLEVVLHVGTRLEGLLGALVAKPVGAPIGIAPKESGAFVVRCLLHLWDSPK